MTSKPFELNVVHSKKRKERVEIDRTKDATAWNRNIENQARQSFKEMEALRSQAETMVDIPKIREGVKADINNKVKRLLNTPAHKRTSQEDELYENLPRSTQKLIDEKHKQRHGF